MQDKCYCTESNLNPNHRIDHNKMSVSEWIKILEIHNCKCVYCGTSFTPNNMPVKDHIIPRNKGGTNQANNITCACSKCNTKKRDKFHRDNGELWAKDNKLIKERFEYEQSYLRM